MFPSIQGEDLGYLMDLLDADQSQKVPIGLLFSYLYQSLPNLDFLEVKRKKKSEWEERVKKLSLQLLDKQVFTEIAMMFKSMEGIVEAAPQLVLQLYIIARNGMDIRIDMNLGGKYVLVLFPGKTIDSSLMKLLQIGSNCCQ